MSHEQLNKHIVLYGLCFPEQFRLKVIIPWPSIHSWFNYNLDAKILVYPFINIHNQLLQCAFLFTRSKSFDHINTCPDGFGFWLVPHYIEKSYCSVYSLTSSWCQLFIRLFQDFIKKNEQQYFGCTAPLLSNKLPAYPLLHNHTHYNLSLSRLYSLSVCSVIL